MQATIIGLPNSGQDIDTLFPLLVTTTNKSSSKTFRIVQVPWSDPAGEALRDAQVKEINQRFGNSDTPPGIPPLASNIALFLLAYEEGGSEPETEGPVACGAARELGDGYMEVGPIHSHLPFLDLAPSLPFPSPPSPLPPNLLTVSNSLICEKIKRMYASPPARGTGASLAILTALERYAKCEGVKGLRLETAVLQPDAMRFYEKYGYKEIPRFGYYENVEWSRCYEKIILEAENKST